MTQPAPPKSQLLAYRLLGVRLPPEYHAWVAEDVAKKSFVNWRMFRTFLWDAVIVGLAVLAITLVHQAPQTRTLIRLAAIPLVHALLLSRNTLMRGALRFHGIDRHGRPVARRKGFGLLDTREAVLAGVAFAVFTTGAAGVYGWGFRPTGFAGVACHKPSSELLGRLKAGFKDESVQFVAPQVVKYKDQSVVVLLYKTTSGVTTGTFDAFFIDHGTIYEVHSAARAPESPTTFPAPPKADLIASDGLRRGLECLQKGLPRPTRP